MPLNKLENFIKNTEGRILYVNPSDLDSTDAIENQGNSLTTPFKTIQRALVEAARFSYLKGNNNDTVEKTTILLYPGEHIVDNRPGYAIKADGTAAKAVSQSGAETNATTEFSLTSSSVFDLTQADNILHKFNSINGGVIIPRGTSLVGLDLRKTKIRPKYVPNPTDVNVGNSAIFRVTGTCYFWQFSIFDGDESGLVYTDSTDFSTNNQSKPTFSHHKLTCFEYADGITIPSGYTISDLAMYYAKLSNAFNSTDRVIETTDRYPASDTGFSPQRPEFEIVGAFAADPINISNIISGDGFTPGAIITVTTTNPHGLNAGTPIKIKGVGVDDYNVSTKVQNVTSTTQFTYLLPFVRTNLPASPSASAGTVTIETDTVTGASPYIFNISLRSVFGMNGMHADGKKATGFRSMVVAQFTGISLQKDDRAFVSYNKSSRIYEGIGITKVTGAELASGSSATNTSQVYHLDSNARYRNGWETVHIKASNDSFLQIVSVFAIGYARHFECIAGADYSVTNSNSNFGQISLASEGFKKEAFSKDDKAFITNIITPKAITSTEEDVDWISLDVGLTTSVGISSHLYLFGFNDKDVKPPVIIQGYRVGAKLNDKLNIVNSGTNYSADIFMTDTDPASGAVYGTTSSVKSLEVSNITLNSQFNFASNHGLLTGEKVKLMSDDADLPENINAHQTYFVIKVSATAIKLGSSLSNAENGTAITVYGGTNLKVLSRVSEKDAGDVGSPIQFDSTNGNWYIHTNAASGIYNGFSSGGVALFGARTNVSFFKRKEDARSIDEKLYKFRVVVPKEFDNAKNPEEGFILQESGSTAARTNADFSLATIDSSDYDYKRNHRFISTCTEASNVVTTITELPHDLDVGDQVIIKNVSSTTNTSATVNQGYNGTFLVTAVDNDKTFKYSTTDVDGTTHSVGFFTNDTSSRTTSLPRFERNDLQANYYIYRNDTIQEYEKDISDGVYHLYVLNADNSITEEYTTDSYSQNVDDLYPQLDRDNIQDNPAASKTFARRSPVGSVVTNDLKKSLTRETADSVLKDLKIGLPITGVTTSFSSQNAGTATLTFDRQHNLSGIVTCSISAGGSGLTNGTYNNVKLFNTGGTTWDGATATVVVSGNQVTQVDVTAGGSGYAGGETLDLDNTFTGGSGARVTTSTVGISTVLGNTVQITGLTTATGGYYRISGVPAANQVAIAITASDDIQAGEYLLNVGHELIVSSSTYDAVTGITTFTTNSPHGFVTGNSFRVHDSSNINKGDFVATGITTTTVVAKTDAALSGAFLLKHGMSANDRASDITGENLGARGLSFFGNERMTLDSNITNDITIHVSVPNAGISTTQRFELGSYFQIDSEIMRVTSSTLSGSGNNEITVIRGALGTLKENHSGGALIKKILPRAVQFHRPSYIRASGHTFEYLGYGPGNYSTGLPQVQVKTLSREEEFLSQAQETAAGIVVYTGMNNDGDFYIGNKLINSSTGKEETFDIPVPTITGQDPARLSVVFDEVIVKERILVEGGKSKTILSEFDGPVNFDKEVKVNDKTTVNGVVKINNTVEITNTTDSTDKDTGSLITEGGVGIEKNLNVGGGLHVTGPSTFVGVVTCQNDLFVGGGVSVVGVVTIANDIVLGGNLQTIGGGGAIVSSGGTFGNIQIGVTNDNTIDTKSGTGNLVIDSAGGTIDINDNVDISGNLVCGGTGTFTGDLIAFSSSDINLKENLAVIPNALSKVGLMTGYTYTWKEKRDVVGGLDATGVIAQEVDALGLPGITTTRQDGTMAVRYEALVPVLIEAIKELEARVKTLEG
jgi:hypothetical protein